MFTGCENCTSSTLYIILSFGLVFRDKIAPPVHNYIVLAFGLVLREDCTPSTHLLDDDVELNVLGCRVDIFVTNRDQCVNMVQCCFTSTETVRLIRTGSPGRPPRLSRSSGTLTSSSAGKGLRSSVLYTPGEAGAAGPGRQGGSQEAMKLAELVLPA